MRPDTVPIGRKNNEAVTVSKTTLPSLLCSLLATPLPAQQMIFDFRPMASNTAQKSG